MPRVCLVGDAGVGKTTLLRRWVDKRPIPRPEPYLVTVGTSSSDVHYEYVVELDDGPLTVRCNRIGGSRRPSWPGRCTLRCIDTGGHPNFRRLVGSYFGSVDYFIVPFDIRRPALPQIEPWLMLIHRYGEGEYEVLLVATFVDHRRANINIGHPVRSSHPLFRTNACAPFDQPTGIDDVVRWIVRHRHVRRSHRGRANGCCQGPFSFSKTCIRIR